MDLGLQSKVAIVTGAATKTGIGQAIARCLAEEGATIVIADINIAGAQAIAAEIASSGGKSMAVEVDQRNHEEVKNAVQAVVSHFGRIDILVNAAALVTNVAALRKMEPERFTNELQVNLAGPWHWLREVMQVMGQGVGGRIVNVSSIAAMVGIRGLPAYAASKGGLNALTKAAAIEGAAKCIAVNSVSLGLISTGIHEGADLKPEAIERLRKTSLLQRMGSPAEVAAVVTFLCSERSSFITGANIVIDGGSLLQPGT